MALRNYGLSSTALVGLEVYLLPVSLACTIQEKFGFFSLLHINTNFLKLGTQEVFLNKNKEHQLKKKKIRETEN